MEIPKDLIVALCELLMEVRGAMDCEMSHMQHVDAEIDKLSNKLASYGIYPRGLSDGD